MTRERTCRACDGTGSVNVSVGTWPSGYSRRRRKVWDLGISCPACQGSGRILEAITAQDAIADAETLIICEDVIYAPPSTGRFCVHLRKGLVSPVQAVAYIKIAARAAFRACPMLRGGRWTPRPLKQRGAI